MTEEEPFKKVFRKKRKATPIMEWPFWLFGCRHFDEQPEERKQQLNSCKLIVLQILWMQFLDVNFFRLGPHGG